MLQKSKTFKRSLSFFLMPLLCWRLLLQVSPPAEEAIRYKWTLIFLMLLTTKMQMVFCLTCMGQQTVLTADPLAPASFPVLDFVLHLVFVHCEGFSPEIWLRYSILLHSLLPALARTDSSLHKFMNHIMWSIHPFHIEIPIISLPEQVGDQTWYIYTSNPVTCINMFL